MIATTNHRTDPYWTDDTAALYVGDARQILAELPDGSVDCLVTSPPYWAKRDYRVPGQYGHEPDPTAYVETLRTAFAEARRVLADDGTCWLNIGDSYGQGWTSAPAPTKPKDLLGLPWRVAFALQDEGWTIRNAIVWHKPNAMPESVRDRLNCRYEMIFLLAKSRRYWFDLDPIRVPHRRAPGAARTHARRRAITPERLPHCVAQPATALPKYGTHATELLTSGRRFGVKMRPRDQHHKAAHPNGRNPADVWAIPTRPYKGPHFAVFPIDIPARCIAAGCRPGGTVADPFCGSGTTGLAPEHSAAALSASTCPPSSSPSPLNGSAMPKLAERKVITTPNDRTKPHHSSGMTRAELLALPVTVDIGTAARALGLGRSTGYELARRGEFPCRVLRVGGSYRVPTADLLRALGIEADQPNPLPPAA